MNRGGARVRTPTADPVASHETSHRVGFARLLVMFVGPFFFGYAFHFYGMGYLLSAGLMLLGTLFIVAAVLINLLNLKIANRALYYNIVLIGVLVPLVLHDIDVVWRHGAMGYLVWFYLYPLLVFFLLGLKRGLVVMIAIFVALLALLFVNLPNVTQVVSVLNLKVQFVVSFLAVSATALVYERTRRATQQSLFAEQENLKRSEASLRKGNEELKRVSERSEQLAVEAQAASAAKSEFLANMSHELRTPLNHIIGFSELVAHETAGSLNDNQKEYMQDVLFSSKHLLSLIDDILDLAKIEAGKIELEWNDVDVTDLCKRSTTMIADSALSKKIDVQTILPEHRVHLWADERRLRQVIYNLLNNAVKFTPEGGSIVFEGSTGEISRGSPTVILTVRDTGLGIDPDNLERVFAPFEQLENALTKRQAGTGLGLSLSKTLVELHGGTIRVESDGPGQGSTFIVELPNQHH